MKGKPCRTVVHASRKSEYDQDTLQTNPFQQSQVNKDMELQNLREGGGGRNGSCISFRKKKILKGKLVVVFSDKQIIDVRRSQLNENIELRNFRELTLSSGETYFLLKSLSLNNSI